MAMSLSSGWREERFTGTFVDDGNAIVGISELSKDGLTWKRDLELTYTRVKLK